LISAHTFTRNPMLEGIRYTGIQYVVYPCDDCVSVNYEIRPRAILPSGMQLCDVPSRPGVLSELLGHKVMTGLPYEGSPLIKPVLCDNFYIFSKEFYLNLPGQSKLECAVRDYLAGRAIDRRLLVVLTETYQAFDGLSRFYYLPIILMLIRANIRSI